MYAAVGKTVFQEHRWCPVHHGIADVGVTESEGLQHDVAGPRCVVLVVDYQMMARSAGSSHILSPALMPKASKKVSMFLNVAFTR